MFSALYRSIVITLLLAFILCGLYPLAITGFSQVFFKEKAMGGFLVKDGKIVGAELIGQNFSDPKYFHGRPSKAGEGYDAANSSGSNIGPTSQKLIDGLKGSIRKVLEENPGVQLSQIPIDLVTSSASGLDPHLSFKSLEIQIPRIAKTRGIDSERIKKLLLVHLEKAQWGVFGEQKVNVLKLNLALDDLN